MAIINPHEERTFKPRSEEEIQRALDDITHCRQILHVPPDDNDADYVMRDVLTELLALRRERNALLVMPGFGDEIRLVCPVRLSPLFDVLPSGIGIRCKSCRGAEHVVRRDKLEELWQALAKGA